MENSRFWKLNILKNTDIFKNCPLFQLIMEIIKI